MSAGSGSFSPPSFGVRIGDVWLALPPGVPVSFLADVVVHPLAGAPRRVMGLMQLQGHPVVVLDPADRSQSGAPAPRRQSVLVLGAPGDGGALRVDEAPAPIALGEALGQVRVPDCVFADALIDPVADLTDRTKIWWRFAPERLFSLLANADEAGK